MHTSASCSSVQNTKVTLWVARLLTFFEQVTLFLKYNFELLIH